MLEFVKHLKECSDCMEETTIQFLATEGLNRLEEGTTLQISPDNNPKHLVTINGAGGGKTYEFDNIPSYAGEKVLIAKETEYTINIPVGETVSDCENLEGFAFGQDCRLFDYRLFRRLRGCRLRRCRLSCLCRRRLRGCLRCFGG